MEVLLASEAQRGCLACMLEFTVSVKDWVHLAMVSKAAIKACMGTLRRAIRRRGIFVQSFNWTHPMFPIQSRLRMRYWEHHLRLTCSANDYEPECEARRYHRLDRDLLQEGQEGEILRDLNRTFPAHPLFRDAGGYGQRALGHILHALMRRFPEIGYSQGMNFVVGILMIIGVAAASTRNRLHEEKEGCRFTSTIDEGTEARIFDMMCMLISRCGMSSLWSPDTSDLKLRIAQLDGILYKKLPRLHAHIHDVGLMLDFFASKWFLTLHSYSLPLQALCIVWDAWVSDGWKAIFRGGLAQLRIRRDHLLTLDMGEIAMLFNRKSGLPKSPPRFRRPHDAGADNADCLRRDSSLGRNDFYEASISTFLLCYSAIKITRSELTDLEHKYKQSRLFAMMEWAIKQRDERFKTRSMRLQDVPSKIDWSMSAYTDPSAPASFGPSVVSFVQSQFQELELNIEVDTKTLRARVEQAEHALKNADAGYRYHLSLVRQLELEHADAVERKDLLASQLMSFLSMDNSGESGVAGRRRPLRSDVSALQVKIESASQTVNFLSKRLFRERALLQDFRFDFEDAKERKQAASHQLLSRIVATKRDRGALAVKLFEQFGLS